MAKVERGPDFICFGMQRAGTRWLYDQLSSHPGAWMPPVKEIGHFNNKSFKPANRPGTPKYEPHGHEQLMANEREEFFRAYTPERRAADPDRWYLDLFDQKNGRLAGDISPEYAALLDISIRWVARVCPDARYLILIRDPVERIWAALNLHLRAKQYTSAQLKNWPDLRAILAGPLHQRRSYPSRIWQRWHALLPEDRARFFFYDDVRDRPAAARRAIFEYLDLDPQMTGLPPDFDRKASQAKMPMPPEIRRKLTRHFMREYERCAATFGGHAVEWLAAARERLARPAAGKTR